MIQVVVQNSSSIWGTSKPPFLLTRINIIRESLIKCKVKNLSEYTINFYNVSYLMFNNYTPLNDLKVSNIDRDLIDIFFP